MDREVQHVNGLGHWDTDVQQCCVTEGTGTRDKMTSLSHESITASDDAEVFNCSTDTDDYSPKFSSYPNGTMRLTDNVSLSNKSSYNSEQSLCIAESSIAVPLTTRETVDRSPSQVLECDNETTNTYTEIANVAPPTNTNHVIDETLSITEKDKESSSDSTGECSETGGEEATGTAANVRLEEHDDSSSVAHQTASLQPLDFSRSSTVKTGMCVTGKQSETGASDSKQKANPKHDTKSDSHRSDSHRPVGRLVHDLGLELIREQVYRDLINIQTIKDGKNQLEEREKGQLLKLIEAQQRLALRNAPYQLPTKRCSRCQFMSSSSNALALHYEYGTVSRVDTTVHVCCFCCGQPGFRTRNATQFMEHIYIDHGMTGRLVKKTAPFSCKNCMFEHKSSVRLAAHVEKCAKKFSLATNLQPLPGDCDIPLIYRHTDRKRPGVSSFMPSNTSNNGSFPASGPPSVRTLLTSLRQQLPAGQQGQACSYNQMLMPSLICEICGKLVDDREALWGHFRSTHHVELCRTTMREKEPWMKCDVCSGRFWTYQGLSRHLLLAHNRALATSFTSGTPATPAIPQCHLCGGSQTSNPLSHFSAYHNVTLLEMYHAKMCCLCNRKVNSGHAFEVHMVEQHSDIFANYDVLRTVLQALTAARYFKADDRREPTTQHIMQLAARADASSAAGHTAADGPVTVSSQTLHRKRHSSGLVGTQSGQKKCPNTNASVTKQKCMPDSSCARKKQASASETQVSPVKTKGATAEEVKKLYEDLANIGRPILRSMRRKLSSDSELRNVDSEDSVSAESCTNDTIEIQAKKVLVQSSDQVCDDSI